MKIFFNNEEKEVEEDISLDNLVESYQLFSKKGIAIALNEVVIPQKKWAETILNENDKLLIITAFQGG